MRRLGNYIGLVVALILLAIGLMLMTGNVKPSPQVGAGIVLCNLVVLVLWFLVVRNEA